MFFFFFSSVTFSDNLCLFIPVISLLQLISMITIISVSLFSHFFYSAFVFQTSYDEDISDAEKVYQECQQSGPISFSDCMPPARMKHCNKIGEGTFGEVFSTINDSNETVALKVCAQFIHIQFHCRSMLFIVLHIIG